MGFAYGVGVQPVLVQGPTMVQRPADGPTQPANSVTIDGTPVRVVVLALSAAAGLTALRWAGFRFNVGVST